MIRLKPYSEAITSELTVAPRLLSEISEARKAALSPEEISFLQAIEAQVNKRQTQVSD